MPLSINNVDIAGTLTRDAEVKYTPKGTAVAEIGLAVNRQWKDEQGAKHEEVLFIDCEAWGRTAEIIGEHTGKGHTIFIEGRLKQETWDDKETGKKRSKIKVVIEKFHFVSKPQSDREEQAPPARQQQRASRPAPPPRPPVDPDLDAPEDDDIPF